MERAAISDLPWGKWPTSYPLLALAGKRRDADYAFAST
jgi:hypothetical protein